MDLREISEEKRLDKKVGNWLYLATFIGITILTSTILNWSLQGVSLSARFKLHCEILWRKNSYQCEIYPLKSRLRADFWNDV